MSIRPSSRRDDTGTALALDSHGGVSTKLVQLHVAVVERYEGRQGLADNTIDIRSVR